MAENESGWTEKGKRSGRGKRPPKTGPETVDATDTSDLGDADEAATPSRPSRRDSSSSSTSESTVTRVPAGDVPDRSDSGARKVARAAATAGQRDVSFRSRLGFPALVALVCLLGIASVVYAWTTRDALASPRQNIDHWHSVYAVYDCNQTGTSKYLPPFQSADDATGIHSHGDGIIHIHPFFELSSGDNAQLRHFLSEMRVEVDPERIRLDTGGELVAGAECGDGSGPAEISVHHWDFDFQALAGVPATNIITTDIGDIKFDHDREVFVIAYAAAGTEITFPEDINQNPLAQRFDTLNNVSAAIEYNPTALRPSDSGVEVQVDGEDADVDVQVVPEDDGG